MTAPAKCITDNPNHKLITNDVATVLKEVGKDFCKQGPVAGARPLFKQSDLSERLAAGEDYLGTAMNLLAMDPGVYAVQGVVPPYAGIKQYAQKHFKELPEGKTMFDWRVSFVIPIGKDDDKPRGDVGKWRCITADKQRFAFLSKWAFWIQMKGHAKERNYMLDIFKNTALHAPVNFVQLKDMSESSLFLKSLDWSEEKRTALSLIHI